MAFDLPRVNAFAEFHRNSVYTRNSLTTCENQIPFVYIPSMMIKLF